MMGLEMQCEKCGRSDIAIVYYVGISSTHCTKCWIAIVAAEPNFNLDAIDAKLNEQNEDLSTPDAIAESTLQDTSLSDLVKHFPSIPEAAADREYAESIPTDTYNAVIDRGHEAISKAIVKRSEVRPLASMRPASSYRVMRNGGIS